MVIANTPLIEWYGPLVQKSIEFYVMVRYVTQLPRPHTVLFISCSSRRGNVLEFSPHPLFTRLKLVSIHFVTGHVRERGRGGRASPRGRGRLRPPGHREGEWAAQPRLFTCPSFPLCPPSTARFACCQLNGIPFKLPLTAFLHRVCLYHAAPGASDRRAGAQTGHDPRGALRGERAQPPRRLQPAHLRGALRRVQQIRCV
jgi:hypothetical protein